jgi:hypothetical protein
MSKWVANSLSRDYVHVFGMRPGEPGCAARAIGGVPARLGSSEDTGMLFLSVITAVAVSALPVHEL